MPLVTVPHPALRIKSTPVVKFGKPMDLMAQHMLDIVHEYNAVGLAANQVGVTLRLIVAHVRGYPPLIMANPEILRAWGEMDVLREGCLSEPGVKVMVPRHRKVRVRYQDSVAKWHTTTATHLLARVIQHEIDHLEGKLIEDYRT